VAVVPEGRRKILGVEHPSGETSCVLQTDEEGQVTSAGMLRTARKLFDGHVFG
jgi:4-oxalomesaconate tautomerase